MYFRSIYRLQTLSLITLVFSCFGLPLLRGTPYPLELVSFIITIFLLRSQVTCFYGALSTFCVFCIFIIFSTLHFIGNNIIL